MNDLKFAVLAKSGSKNDVKSDFPLRSDDVDGYYVLPPEVGNSFRFFSAPLDEKMDIRVVTTSPVVKVEESVDGLLTFETLNSTYSLYAIAK